MQTQFDRKPKRVSGWEMPFVLKTDDWPLWTNIPHPGWLQDALQRRVLKLESFPSIDHWVMRVELPGKKVIYAYAGSWITCDENGALMARRPEEMDEDWEVVPV